MNRYESLRILTNRYELLRIVTNGYESLRIVTNRYEPLRTARLRRITNLRQGLLTVPGGPSRYFNMGPNKKTLEGRHLMPHHPRISNCIPENGTVIRSNGCENREP